MSEAKDMVTLEKARLNVWNVGVVIIAAILQSFAVGVLYNKMTNADIKAEENDARAVQAIAELNATVKDIELQLPQISRLQFDMTRVTELVAENREANKQTNERVDRVVESFGGKLDTLVENVNKMGTRVEVIANQLGVKAQRTRFTSASEPIPDIILKQP